MIMLTAIQFHGNECYNLDSLSDADLGDSRNFRYRAAAKRSIYNGQGVNLLGQHKEKDYTALMQL